MAEAFPTNTQIEGEFAVDLPVILERRRLVVQQIIMNDAIHTAAHAKYTQVEATGSYTGRIAGIRDTARRGRTTRPANKKIGKRIHDQVTAA